MSEPFWSTDTLRSVARAVFQRLDTDRRGLIDLYQVRRALQSFLPAITEAETKDILNELHSTRATLIAGDNDGVGGGGVGQGDAGESGATASSMHVNERDFYLLLASQLSDCLDRDEIGDMFKIVDMDGDGAISVQDLVKHTSADLQNPLSSDEANLMLRAADVDKDGSVTLRDVRDVLLHY